MPLECQIGDGIGTAGLVLLGPDAGAIDQMTKGVHAPLATRQPYAQGTHLRVGLVGVALEYGVVHRKQTFSFLRIGLNI